MGGARAKESVFRNCNQNLFPPFRTDLIWYRLLTQIGRSGHGRSGHHLPLSSITTKKNEQLGWLPSQGYLAHEKTPTSLGPSQDPRHRPTVGSWGGEFSCK